MQNFILTRIIRWLAGKMNGYKTVIGGVGLLCTGIAQVIAFMYPDLTGLDPAAIDKIVNTFTLAFGGMLGVGIAGKAEKIKTAIEASKPTASEEVK